MSRLYLFNPFNIHTTSVEQLSEEYVKILETIKDDDGIPFIIADNIEKYANLYVIIGEMIARYKREVDDAKQSIKQQETLQIYKQRDSWIASHDGKPPAMSYFEARAYDQVKVEYQELNATQEKYKRFLNAWESTDAKIQALKKKYEAKKYELNLSG